MKTCVTCHVAKPSTAFNVRRSASDGLQPRCRDCCKAWYQANKQKHCESVAERGRRVRNQTRAYLLAYLLENPCVDCGENDVRVLELDHRPGTRKRDAVTVLVRQGNTWGRILEEIAKCDVRCANCHRKVTAQRSGSLRQQVMELVQDLC